MILSLLTVLTQKLVALDLLFFSPNFIINTSNSEWDRDRFHLRKIMWLQQNVENYVSARITFIKLEQTELSDILIQFRPTSRLAMILWLLEYMVLWNAV